VKSQTCEKCKTGTYQGGSSLYDYYTCGHALEKPLNDEEKEKWVHYPSPYPVMQKSKKPKDAP
jgi:hypothetical protein